MLSDKENEVIITIQKAPIPIIWLDTSVIIRMTKVTLGENLGIDQPERYFSLYERLLTLTQQNKIICPAGEQNIEIEHGKRLERQCYDLQLQLSRGVDFKPAEDIKSLQRQMGIKAHLNGDKEIKITYTSAFYEDPCEEIIRPFPVIVGVFGKAGPRLIQREKQDKQEALMHYNALKQSIKSLGLTYEDQLIQEQGSLVFAARAITLRWQQIEQENLEPSLKDMDQLFWLNRLFLEWENCGGEADDIEGFESFFQSEMYLGLPHVDISLMLWARLMTNDGKVASGDSMDISHLSTVVPYCQYVITDKKMRNISRNLGIDQKYNTTIYCMSDFEQMISELDNII